MTKVKDPNRPKKWPTGYHESGYCLPPESGRIKKGEVRNPWGPKGKPKPIAIDPFEFAASQPAVVTIDGEQRQVTAETAAHLVNMQKAIAGDARAHRNVQDERRARRSKGSPPKSAEEIQREAEDVEKRKGSAAKLIGMIDAFSELLGNGLCLKENGKIVLAPYVIEALGDYREKHGAPRDPGPGGHWSPHPASTDDDSERYIPPAKA